MTKRGNKGHGSSEDRKRLPKPHSEEERLEWALVACLATFATVAQHRFMSFEGVRLNVTALAALARSLGTPDAIPVWLDENAWPFGVPGVDGFPVVFPVFVAILRMEDNPYDSAACADLAACGGSSKEVLAWLSIAAERELLRGALERSVGRWTVTGHKAR